MGSKSKTIANLNRALQMEVSATHQYQLHAHVLDDWGLDKLAAKMREEQAEEIGHSDLFIARILMLKGEPEIAFAQPPRRAATLLDMFNADLADEIDAFAFYLEAARDANADDDLGTQKMFEQIALDEEGHRAWLELQIDLINRIGEAAYSAKFVSLGEETNSAA